MAMKFALFYEIPVPRPWTAESEHEAYKNTLEEAVLGDKVGFHSFWTVEHHFLEEYSHCSNPEVLYGAIAARTENIRLGYGVRLLPQALQPPDPHGRVGGGARSDLRRARRVRHRALVDACRARRLRHRPPRDPGDVERGARPHRGGVDRGDLPGRRQVLEDGRARAGCSRSRCRSRTRRCGGRRRAPTATARSVATVWGCARSPSACRPRSWPIASPSTARAWPSAPQPVGKFVNDQAATFTMVHCAPTKEEAYEVAAESCAWYVSYGARLIALGGRAARGQGPRHLRLRGRRCSSTIGPATSTSIDFEFLHSSGSAVVGDPEECIATAKRYEAAGCDLLLCLVNPLKIPHDKVMQSIELLGPR